MGSYLQLNFKQQEGSFQSIISEIPVDQSKEISYFEIEIENMPKNETSIVIGFATETDYVKTFSPGEYPNSVGFKSSIDKCEAFLNNKAMATFEFSVKFGETFGFFLFI